METITEMYRREQRALEAMRKFPLPISGNAALENYQRILDWLYGGNPSPASLVIDLTEGSRHGNAH